MKDLEVGPAPLARALSRDDGLARKLALVLAGSLLIAVAAQGAPPTAAAQPASTAS